MSKNSELAIAIEKFRATNDEVLPALKIQGVQLDAVAPDDIIRGSTVAVFRHSTMGAN